MVASSEKLGHRKQKEGKLLDKEERVISVSHPLPYKHTTYKGLHTKGREGLYLTPTFMYCSQTSICGFGSLMPPGGGQKETLFFCSIYSLAPQTQVNCILEKTFNFIRLFGS